MRGRSAPRTITNNPCRFKQEPFKYVTGVFFTCVEGLNNDRVRYNDNLSIQRL